MKATKCFLVMFLVLILAACSRTFFVKVYGELNDGIQFCFYKNLTDENTTEYELRDFGVQKLIGDSWKDVWTIEEVFRTRCLVYGVKSKNYQTLVQAKQLEAGAMYRVGASDMQSPVGYASLRFKISQSGKLKIEK